MKKWRTFAVLGALALLAAFLISITRNPRAVYPTQNGSPESSSNRASFATEKAASGEGAKEPFDEKVNQLKAEALTEFNKLCEVLQPYNGYEKATQAVVVLRTNRLGGVNVEIGVGSSTHTANFVAGPIGREGRHENSSLRDGALLRKLTSLYDSSDTRRNPGAAASWYQATGTWSEDEAVRETFRLMEEVGIPTNIVVRHRFHASAMTVSDPSGASVRVRPFYSVQMCSSSDDDYSYFLGVEYRMGNTPPGKVTEWFSWPPIKIK
jgi:hypothetical protein